MGRSRGRGISQSVKDKRAKKRVVDEEKEKMESDGASGRKKAE